MDSDEGRRPVVEVLHEMIDAIRSGNMLLARSIGEQSIVPLSLTSSDVKLIGKLSEGSEGAVYQATWSGREVAVKKVRISTSADLDRFRRELVLLAGFNHPAVVPLLGARALPPDYWLVLPLAAGGNVRQALYDKGWRPSWRQVLDMGYTVASGMEHVHAAAVLHRDLKPANLLLLQEPPPQPPPSDPPALAQSGDQLGAAQNGAASRCALAGEHVAVQIADFGIAVRLEEGGEDAAEGGEEEGTSTGAAPANPARGGRGGVRKPSGGFHKQQMVGTLEYMAPELLLRTAPTSRASDVYAWAVTVNEIATGVVPFSDCTKDNPEVHTVLEMGYGRLELAAAVCSEGLRPLMPRSCPPGFAALMRACWEREPGARPSFTQVRHALERIAEDLPRWEQEQQQEERQLQEHHEDDHRHRGLNGTGPQQQQDKGGDKQPQVPRTVVVSAMVVDGPDPPAAPTTTSSSHGSVANGCNAAAPYVVSGCAGGMNGSNSEGGDGAAAAAARPVIQPPFVLCPEGQPEEGCGWGGSGSGSDLRQGGAGAGREGVAFLFNGGVFEAIGPRDSMEDRHVLLADVFGRQQTQQQTQQPQGHQEGPLVPVAAVFDGHRGAEAAEYCRAMLPEVLRAAAAECAESPAEALRRAFVRLEEGFYARWAQRHFGSTAAAAAALAASGGRLSDLRTRGGNPLTFPGTTAIVALLAPGGRLYLANAGDCRAVLCRGRTALAGSRDHTGLLEDERRRLAAAGVAVTWQHGGWRIGSSGLQVTRCIGDFDVKGLVPGTTTAAGGGGGGGGVTAVPEVTAVQLRPEDHFLVLASDGLWDVMSVQEAVGLVYDTVKDPALAAKRLAAEALMRGSADNVSVVVVFLSAAATCERVYGAADGEAHALTGTAYGSRVRIARDRHVAAAADEMRDTY